MLDKNRLGLEIKRIRKAKNLTQNQLAHDMCSQSEISRIEAGEFFPSMDLLYLISNRLNISLNYFFEILTHEQAEKTNILKAKIRRFSLNKNYIEMYNYIDKSLKEEVSNHPETKKFLLWKKNLAAYYLKKIDAETCKTELLLLLRKKFSGMEISLDLEIKNSIANILAENNRYEESLKIYKSILVEHEVNNENSKLHLKVIYNLGKLLFIKAEFSSALQYTNLGIVLSIQNFDMALLGQFYYQKGSVLEKLNCNFDQISSAYKKSLFFFDITELEIYTKILVENKSAYL